MALNQTHIINKSHNKSIPVHLHVHPSIHSLSLSPEGLWRQYAEARLLQHLANLVAAARHRVGLHLPGALLVTGELHVARQVGDGEAIALLLLDLGDVGRTVLLLMYNPAQQLLEDYEEEV